MRRFIRDNLIPLLAVAGVLIMLIWIGSGCAAKNDGTVETSLAKVQADIVAAVAKITTAKTTTTQTAGRDATNISPTVVMSGGTGLVFVIVLAAVIRTLLKYRRALTETVKAVEAGTEHNATTVKRQVTKRTLDAGVADLTHSVVKRNTPQHT